jgi:hypothetical protein
VKLPIEVNMAPVAMKTNGVGRRHCTFVLFFIGRYGTTHLKELSHEIGSGHAVMLMDMP